MSEAPASRRALPPVWILGLANAPLGTSGALGLLTIPQLLAARHVPEPRIAEITGLALVPSFCVFLAAPILDVRFSRRAYAVGFTAAGALLSLLALLAVDRLEALGWLLFAAFFSVSLATAASGGWFATLIPKEQESGLGAWLVVWNIGGFGLLSVLGITLLRALPTAAAAAILAALVFAPAAVFAFVPAPGPDRRLAKESFGQLMSDLAGLVRQPAVLLTLLLFAVPAASFALTNTLGGIGRDFAASERFVALIGGMGVTAGGVMGSLAVPPLAARIAPRRLYLAIGAVGALFTLGLIVLPRAPGVFALAMVGENVFQAAAFATVNTVIIRSIGKDNPFAATQFALLLAAQGLPLTYMQVLDGRAYGAAGVMGAFLADGGLGLFACAVLALVLWAASRRAGASGGP